ncbi:hypothetical protein MSC39_12865 [Acinetobacter nosocomialis]|uniref:hypothetical protein n=1 Tax=Acinetobacter calcoaceticus/baumannii complex TaxID=909768 RepID=UPI00044B8299|nr:hypothetical protein [Acinetobacter baumannii]EXA87194.1 hypothetical protein J517_1618 [Acinetobacter baumannii 118362]SSS79017.1 Uncharacterised protein [Acinetobacter baumannii]
MKKLNNALNAYASHVKAEDVYVLADDTFWGKADNGLLITNSEILVKESFEDPKKISLMELQQVAFEGLLGGNFVINHQKVIAFTQLDKNDRNKLLSILIAFLNEEQILLAEKADQRAEELKKQAEIENIEREKQQLEQKAHLLELEKNYAKMSLSEIIYSQDEFIMNRFIGENNLVLLKKTNDKLGVYNPELFLNFEYFGEIVKIFKILNDDNQVVYKVLDIIYEIYNIYNKLPQKKEVNKIFEILIYQNQVAVSLVFMVKIINEGYLKKILSYMPSDRSQDIIIRYNKVYNIILSQYLLSLATKEKLGDVLIRTQDLMKLDSNSDQYFIELNRVQKAISKNKNHSFELFKDFIVRALNNDILANENLGLDEEQYDFTEVKSVTSEYILGCISTFLEGAYVEEIDSLQDALDEVLDYLEDSVKLTLSSTYL